MKYEAYVEAHPIAYKRVDKPAAPVELDIFSTNAASNKIVKMAAWDCIK